MNLPTLAVRRPHTTLMVFLALALFGVISLTHLKLALFPEMTPPAITVIVPYPGASATDVENGVVVSIEDTLSTVNNLEHLNAIAKDNVAQVTCEFAWGTDLDAASNDIRDKLEMVKSDLASQAPDAYDPMIFKFSSSMMPIMIVSVNAAESWEQLHHIVDKEIVDPIRRVPGVGAVVTYGGLKRQINVWFDGQKLESLNLSLDQIARSLAAENLDLPAGYVRMGRREYQLRVPGRYRNPSEIADVIVASANGRPVYLRDVAQVQDGFADERLKSRSEGEPGMLLMVQKQSDANTVSVIRAVKKRIATIRDSLPGDVRVEVSRDDSTFILNSLRNLGTTLLIAGVLVVLVTYLFLRSTAPTIIIAVAIPFTLIGSFIYLYIQEVTINLISMMTFSVCIGMVVDSAIVVLENITRHLDEGEDTEAAAVNGASEVSLALSASTLTTIVVFVPLIFVTGMAGLVFRQLGAIVVVTLGGALLTALTLTPMLCSQYLRKHATRGEKTGASGRFATVEAWYRSLLGRALRRRALTVVSFVTVFVVTLGLLRLIGTELFPEMDTGEISVAVELDEGTRLEETERVAEQVMDIVAEQLPERRGSRSWFGETEEQLGVTLGMAEGTHTLRVAIELVPRQDRDRSDKEVAEALRQAVAGIPGIQRLAIGTDSIINLIISGGGKPLIINVTGHDLNDIQEVVKEVKEIVSQVPGAIEVSTSEHRARSEMQVVVDREKAAQLGVSMAMVAQTLRAHYHGYTATRFRDSGEDYDVVLRLPDRDRRTLEGVGDVSVASNYGTMIPLKNIAELRPATGPIWIDRKDRQRVISVEADTLGRSLGEVTRDIERKLEGISVPPGVEISFAGQVEEQREAFAELSLLLTVGILLVYMVMVAQFESLKTPFVIMFSVPFAFTGAIWALAAARSSLNIVALIGMVLLVGVVVNNAIVLVDYANTLRSRGLSVQEAIVTAASRRLRPVAMTALTTVLAMAPLCLGLGEGAELWQPFGLTVAGGMTVSTLVTLILVPTMYAVVEGRRGKSSA